jgi:hypothetical protein
VLFMKVDADDANWIMLSGTSRSDVLNNVSVEESTVLYHKTVLSPASG